MTQRGRKSAAALTAVASITGRMPTPVAPAALTAAERAVWRRTVDRAPLGWFLPEQADLLTLYVCHVAEAQRLRKVARSDELGLDDFAKLSGMAARESALALAYARALRLTTQARTSAGTAGRRANGSRPQQGIAALFEDKHDEA